MPCLKKRTPESTRNTTLCARPLPPLSNNEALALWLQASHFFHHLHWTSTALLVTQILRRTSTSNIPGIARAKLWSNLGIVHFHLGEHYAALKAIEEALDEVSTLMGLTVNAADNKDARDAMAARSRSGTLTDFIRAGAARITPPLRRRCPEGSSVPIANELSASPPHEEQNTTSPPRISRAVTVANTITTIGRFIRAGAAWSADLSSTVNQRRAGSTRGTISLTRMRSSRATWAANSEDTKSNCAKSLEAGCPEAPQGNTVEASKTTKHERWNPRSQNRHSAIYQERRPHSVSPKCPLSSPKDPLPFPPETPLLFFLAGLAAYHLPTTPQSPINYFRVAHAYFKRCLWSLTLLSRTAAIRPPSAMGQNDDVTADEDTHEEVFADEYGVDDDEELGNEQASERAESFDFSPYGFSFVLSRRSVITNALTCDYEAECIEGRGTLVVGRCRGVEGLGAGVEGVWFEAPLG